MKRNKEIIKSILEDQINANEINLSKKNKEIMVDTIYDINKKLDKSYKKDKSNVLNKKTINILSLFGLMCTEMGKDDFINKSIKDQIF